jgi:PAS domain-containing protein
MEQLERLHPKHGPKQVSQSARWASPAILISIAAFLLLMVVRSNLQGEDIPRFLMVVVGISFFAAISFGTYFLLRALREYRESEDRFQQMASNIREIFWMIDAESKKLCS